MSSVNVRQRVSSSFAVASSLVLSLLVGCGGDGAGSSSPDDSGVAGESGGADDSAFPTTIDECGSNLSLLLGAESDASPRLEASYSEALAEWYFPDDYCGLGVFSGVCADGKRVLYRNGGFTSEIRYYEGEQLVGYVGSGDVGFCPSVCPFSRFFGTPASVRCEAPSFEALCDRVPAPADGAAVWMPFANGQAPGGCTP